MLYKNKYGTQTYPFISSVPFPLGMIADIKLGLKDTVSTEAPFISNIAGSKQHLNISVSSAQGLLGTFQYTGNKWITLDNQKLFGFILLNFLPAQSFSFTGRWEIFRGCYTFGVEFKGLKTAYVQQAPLRETQLLHLFTSGLLTQRTSQKLGDWDILNIGRDTEDPYYELTEEILNQQPFISTVNGISVKNLILDSSDSSILIQPLQQIPNTDIYILYIDTNMDFPHCPEWDDISSSSQAGL